jgi:short-subunit dehydrogenase
VSLKSFADFATYSASKAAAYSITQALRDKLKAQGSLVLSVHPGPIATDMANSAGFGASAEPASLVADGIVAALAAGEFHVFPDRMARNFWSAYQDFAGAVVEAEVSEG